MTVPPFVQNYNYDELGRLIEVLHAGSSTSQQYDLNNNPETETNGYNATSSKQYDSLNRLTQYIDELNGVIHYTYNTQNQLTSVTDDNGATTRYDYDGLGRLQTLISPDTGRTSYQYDDAGNPTEVVDARGQRVSQKYDALNRLTEKQYDGARDEDVRFGYDSGNNGIGKLSLVNNGSSSIDFAYDPLGRLIEQTNTLLTDTSGNIVASTRYGYDGVTGVLNSITYPSNMFVDYQTDGLGEITGINISGNDPTFYYNIASNIRYSAGGQLTSLTYGNDLVKSEDSHTFFSHII